MGIKKNITKFVIIDFDSYSKTNQKLNTKEVGFKDLDPFSKTNQDFNNLIEINISNSEFKIELRNMKISSKEESINRKNIGKIFSIGFFIFI